MLWLCFTSNWKEFVLSSTRRSICRLHSSQSNLGQGKADGNLWMHVDHQDACTRQGVKLPHNGQSITTIPTDDAPEPGISISIFIPHRMASPDSSCISRWVRVDPSDDGCWLADDHGHMAPFTWRVEHTHDVQHSKVSKVGSSSSSEPGNRMYLTYM